MEDSIVINNNNKDMFNIDIPSFDTGGTVVPPPVPTVQQPSEMETIASKSLVSFGTMGICIVAFLLFVLIFKKRKTNIENSSTEEINDIEIQKEEQVENIGAEKPAIRQQKKTYLNTPSSIHKCIKSFLENTKEN